MMGVKPSPCKLVLLCLADCHNADNGRCDPSGSFISRFTGLDKKTVFEALKLLEAMGLIKGRKRVGNSTQFDLLIHSNPVPIREKGERKMPVQIARVSRKDLTRIRVNPDMGQVDKPDPNTGQLLEPDPNTGQPKYGSTGVSRYGSTPDPNTGHEPTKNLPVEPTSSESSGADSAATAAKPVDNSLRSLGVDYQSPTAVQQIFRRGVDFLTRFPGMTEQRARACLARWVADHGEGRTLDAVVVAILSAPEGDSVAFIQGVLARQPHLIAANWQPEPNEAAALEGMGIPPVLMREARDVFVVWFRSMEIMHSDWPRLFRDWVWRDWQESERQVFEYRRRLAESAGMQYEKPFQEPA
jgi:hypothetical protein